MKLPKAYSTAVMSAMSHSSVAARMTPGSSPKWYVIEVYEGAERKVSRELIARRYGIYIPEKEEVVVERGRKIERTTLLFPGYIFVFVWDAWDLLRIAVIDGVIRVICDANGPPLSLGDDEIDHIRRIENCERPIQLEEFQIEVDGPKSKMKKKRGRRTKRVVISVTDEVVRTRAGGWSRGDFDDTLNESVMTLDSPGRNQTLMRALGLCS